MAPSVAPLLFRDDPRCLELCRAALRCALDSLNSGVVLLFLRGVLLLLLGRLLPNAALYRLPTSTATKEAESAKVAAGMFGSIARNAAMC